ncbi:MAG TPA: MJ1255/VC2487 family glycosyltransferase [Bacteroidia bacterium]|jgi:uncharacterized protein (TIGR00661 family)|nr:MJ1255/VC2487 family glycosyltransferase [Bacteroidia bacterium]
MNILYGVPGEGMGHATRSKVVIEHLLKQHNVQVVSGARAYRFLNKSFPGRVHEIKGFHFAYKNAQVSKTGTFMLNLKNVPRNLLFNFSEYLHIQNNFKPDLVISDFESFSFVYAKHHHLPLISIDNMQVIDRCRLDIEISKAEKKNYVLAKGIVKSKVPGCKHYFITSFFDAELSEKNTSIVPPIVREAVINAKPEKGNHILMYQTSSTFSSVREVLHNIPGITFYVYGFNKDEKDRNVIFKSFSEEDFVKDLASAKAVIANGGFSFISEAVYLKKPVYSFPLKNQFEQFVNASYIDKLGYGRHFSELTSDNLKSFLYDLESFEKNLSAYTQKANEVLFGMLDGEIKKAL